MIAALNKTRENQALLAKRRLTLLKNPTPPEAHIRNLLIRLQIQHQFQKGFLSLRTHYIVDFYFKRLGSLCLEIDGGYHLTPEQKSYDEGRTRYLTQIRHFRVKRLTNEQALAMTAKSLSLFLKT